MTGAVYDRGYRPYEGDRGGRAASVMALFRSTLRRALGLRRSWRQKVPPFVLLGIVTIPAVVNVGVKYLTRGTAAQDVAFITYRDYVGVSNALLVFVALTAPDIICPDRRQRVLPLIFARPLTGRDYVLAKVGAMASILFAFSFLPQVVLFLGQMLVSDDGAIRYLRDNAEVLWQVPAAVALLALFYASIGVALASLTSRRIIAGASIIGLFLISSIVAGVAVQGRDAFEETGGELVICTEGPTTTGGSVGGPFGGSSGDEECRVVRGEIRDDGDSPAILADLLGLPLVLRDIVFLGHVDPGHPLSGVANGGLYAFGVYALLVGGSIALLLVRYDEVSA